MILCHVGAPSTRQAVELAKHAESCGVDAVSAVPCVFYIHSEDAIANHWNTITEAVDLPFFIYNIPQLTGFNLSRGLFERMLQNEKIAGIKNSNEVAHQIMQFKALGGENFIVLNGPDEQFLAGRLMGADAGIGGTYGPMPELYMKLEEYICAGEIEKARRLQERFCSLFTACALSRPCTAPIRRSSSCAPVLISASPGCRSCRYPVKTRRLSSLKMILRKRLPRLIKGGLILR